MGYTGKDERAFIMDATTGIGALAGSRVWKGEVPDPEQIERLASGGVKPYIVVTFQMPFPSKSGRSLAGGEKKQPYVMPFMVVSYAGDPDSAEELDGAVRDKLLDAIPSPTAGPIAVQGGFTAPVKDTTSRPTRHAAGTWFDVLVNLGI